MSLLSVLHLEAQGIQLILPTLAKFQNNANRNKVNLPEKLSQKD